MLIIELLRVHPARVPIGEESLRRCVACNAVTFHEAVARLVQTPHGTVRMTVWSCEVHVLPSEGLVIDPMA